jgi:sulfur-oxidizing protein SoxX
MRKTAKFMATAASLAVLVSGISLIPQTAVADNHGNDMVKMGKEVAVDRKKGNCLACHMMDDGASPGDIGPPLVAMKARFPDKAKLRAQIWDPQVANPGTRMPPFGKHKIVSEKDIDAIVEYLYTL